MTVGTPPGTGPQLVDGVWLQGVSGGANQTYQYGITASGTSSQSAAFQLPGGINFFEVDTAAANSGVALPAAIAGTDVVIYNNTSTATLVVYPQIANNPLTGAQDTINNTTSLTMAAHAPVAFFCAKNGVWGAK